MSEAQVCADSGVAGKLMMVTEDKALGKAVYNWYVQQH